MRAPRMAQSVHLRGCGRRDGVRFVGAAGLCAMIAWLPAGCAGEPDPGGHALADAASETDAAQGDPGRDAAAQSDAQASPGPDGGSDAAAGAPSARVEITLSDSGTSLVTIGECVGFRVVGTGTRFRPGEVALTVVFAGGNHVLPIGAERLSVDSETELSLTQPCVGFGPDLRIPVGPASLEIAQGGEVLGVDDAFDVGAMDVHPLLVEELGDEDSVAAELSARLGSRDYYSFSAWQGPTFVGIVDSLSGDEGFVPFQEVGRQLPPFPGGWMRETAGTELAMAQWNDRERLFYDSVEVLIARSDRRTYGLDLRVPMAHLQCWAGDCDADQASPDLTDLASAAYQPGGERFGQGSIIYGTLEDRIDDYDPNPALEGAGESATDCDDPVVSELLGPWPLVGHGRDTVYRVSLEQGQQMRLGLYSWQDLVLYLVPEMELSAGVSLACAGSDLGEGAFTESLHFTAPAAETYYVIVDQRTPADGWSFTLYFELLN